MQLWDRGYWHPTGRAAARQALTKGELRFTLEAEHLKGGWILVRLKVIATTAKKTNWLLIKHRDECAVEGDDASQRPDKSVASGRSMAAIAAGRGRGPRLFMMATDAAAPADAVWDPKTRRGGSGRGRLAATTGKAPARCAIGDARLHCPPALPFRQPPSGR